MANTKPGLCCSRRLELAVLVLFGVLLTYSFRVAMSVSMVCMTTVEEKYFPNGHIKNNLSRSKPTHESVPKLTPDFDWDKRTQGMILGSFFWAYCATPIFGGWLAQKVGGTKLFGLSVSLSSVLTLMTPVAANTHVAFLVIVRALVGLAQIFGRMIGSMATSSV